MNAQYIISKLDSLARCSRNGKTIIAEAINTIERQQREHSRYADEVARKALEYVGGKDNELSDFSTDDSNSDSNIHVG